MPRTSKRTTIATGIYADASGFEVRAIVGDWSKAHRFPPNATLKEMKTWQEDTRARLRHSGVTHATRGTLAADVDLLLARVGHLAGWKSLRSELRAWVRVYGPRRRRSLEPTDILAARHQWLSDGVAPLTIVNRESALRRLWHQLDGRKASTPFDDLSAIASHRTPIVVIPPALVLRVYAVLTTWRREGRRGLHDSKTRARFMVYASTGRRPSEIARAQFTDVDFQRGIWYPRDGKGGFSPGIYLNADMLAAWSLFAGANAWGRFRNFTPILRKAGWPDDVRPYNLRHTVGITMSEAGVDLADVGPHLGHKRLETTRRHYVPVLHSRLQQASERIDKRFGW